MHFYPRLNPSVQIVKLDDGIIEFFKTCIRRTVNLRVENDTVLDIVTKLDGTRTLEQISEEHKIALADLQRLVEFLQSKGLLDNVTPTDDFVKYESFHRVIHMLAEYSHSHQHLVTMWNNIRHSTVLIVGLGAVGSWVACNLVQTGVTNLILMDRDSVDISNLHRQFGYGEKSVGMKKADVLEKQLFSYAGDLNILKEYSFLDGDSLHVFDDRHIDLIINCADKPTVDQTSLWIGEYSMKRKIPHIIGGGYNMHLSLIGQTVIPGQTACVKCFQKKLESENTIDPKEVKRLNVKNRKVGSFGPMCSIIASMIGMEAVKVLSGGIMPSNINRRGEFDIFTMAIKYIDYPRRDDCEWCGKNGKYCHC